MKNKEKNNKIKENTSMALSRSAVSAEPEMLTQREPMFKSGIIQYLLINILIMSSMLSGLSYIYTAPYYMMIFIYCAVLTGLLCFPKKKSGALLMIAATAFFIYRKWQEVIGGIAVLITEYMRLFGVSDKSISALITISTRESQVTWALIVYGALMSLILYETVFVHKNLIITFFITFILPEIGLYNGDVPRYMPTFALLISWICVFAMQLSDYNVSKKQQTATFSKARKKNAYYLTGSDMKTSAFAQLSVQICLITASAIIIAIIGSALSGHERSKNVDILRRNLATDFSYESFVDAINQMQGGFNIKLKSNKPDLGASRSSGGLSMGKLGNAYNLKFSGQTLLELTYINSSAISQPIYLRGFAAGDYSDGQWSASKDWDDYIVDDVWDAVSKSPLSEYQDVRLLDAISQYGSLNLTFNNFSYLGYLEGSSNSSTPLMTVKDLSGSGLFFTPYFGSYMLGDKEYEDGDFHFDDKVKAIQNDYATIKDDEYDTLFYSMNYMSDVELYSRIGYYNNSFDPAKYCLVRAVLAQGSDEQPYDICDVIDKSPFITNNVWGFSRQNLLSEICRYVDNYIFNAYGDDTMYVVTTKDPEGDSLDDMFDILVFTLDSAEEQTIAPSEFLRIATEIYLDDLKEHGSDTKSIADVIYTDYVLSHYLDVDIDINPAVIEHIDSPLESMGLSDPNAMFNISYSEYVQDVISYLKSYYEYYYVYSLQVEKTPDDQDFIEYFLNDMNAGSCTYFSSAAVEILRYYGIPARYVEGFMIPGGNSQRSGDDYNTFSINVTDKYSHAWVEVYYPGIGWLPIEFTLDDPNDINNPPTVTTREPTSTTTTTAEPEVTTAPSATTTKAPDKEVTTTVSGSESVSLVTTPKKEDGLSSAFMKNAATAMMIIVILGVMILGYVFLHDAVKKSIEESINGSDENINCVNIYNLILRYLACAGIICNENITDKERCRKLCLQLVGTLPHEICDGLAEVCDLAVEAGMSDSALTADDTKDIRKLLAMVKFECYEKMTRMQRFKAKFILGLY